MAEEKKTEIPRDPVSLMEGAFLLGIGILEMSKEKSQDLANELMERGKMSQSDAKKVADRIGEIAGEQQETLRKTVSTETSKALKTSGLATKDEVADLKSQIAELKEMLAASAAKGGAKGDAK
jgi:polyhydroxyalkanoate synthesis regulator phasin